MEVDMARTQVEQAVEQVETETVPETAPIAYETGTEELKVDFSFINDTVALSALWNDIPLTSRVAYFIRGFKHAGQNEVSAQAGNKLASDLEVADKSKVEKNTACEAWRKANPDGWNAMLKAELDKRWKALMEGTVSARDSGPRDPIGQELMVLVDRAIRERLKNERDPNGDKIKFPTNDDDEIVFANGATRTRKQMRDNFKAAVDAETGETNEAILRRQAEDIVAARNKAVKVEKPAGQGPEALGL
jgi:hypothetical protein